MVKNLVIDTYIDAETGVEVKVYAPATQKKRVSRPYVSMKERDEKRLESNQRVAFAMNAYDAAAVFGMQREEAVRAPEATSDFEAILRRERARFNRRRAK